jgi:hypothetical protein
VRAGRIGIGTRRSSCVASLKVWRARGKEQEEKTRRKSTRPREDGRSVAEVRSVPSVTGDYCSLDGLFDASTLSCLGSHSKDLIARSDHRADIYHSSLTTSHPFTGLASSSSTHMLLAPLPIKTPLFLSFVYIVFDTRS